MSNLYAYFMVAVTILLTVYGQFILKWQLVTAGSFPSAWPERFSYAGEILLNPWILSVFVAWVLAALAWMLALTRLPITHAFPMTAMTFVIVAFGGALFFNEPLSSPKLVGVALIVLGIAVGSQG